MLELRIKRASFSICKSISNAFGLFCILLTEPRQSSVVDFSFLQQSPASSPIHSLNPHTCLRNPFHLPSASIGFAYIHTLSKALLPKTFTMSDGVYGQQQRVQNVQPGVSQKMDIKNAMNMPKDEAGQRDWSNGLFTCLEDVFTCKRSLPF